MNMYKVIEGAKTVFEYASLSEAIRFVNTNYGNGQHAWFYLGVHICKQEE